MANQGAILSPIKKLDFEYQIATKIIYFTIGALYYVFYSFRMKFFKNYFGLNEDASGILQASLNIASFIGVTGWNNLADLFGIHKRLLVTLCIAMAGIFQVLHLKLFLLPEYRIWLAVSVFGLFGLMVGGIMPLTDYQILKLLKDHFKKDEKLYYSRQVLFGTIASGLTTYGLGSLIDVFGVNIIFSVLPIVAFIAALCIALFGHPDSRPSSDGNKDSESGQSQTTDTTITTTITTGFKTYFQTMMKPRFVLFILSVLSIGVGRQVAINFLVDYLTEEIGLTSGQYGRAYMGSSLFSLIFLFSGPCILNRLGVRLMLLIGLGAMTIRLGAYALIVPSTSCPLQVMLIELLNGTSFSFTHLAGVREAAACAPAGWEATFQAAYTCAYVQFPAIFCSIFGGVIYRRYGGAFLMKLTATFSAFSFLLIIAVLFISTVTKARAKLLESLENKISN